LRAGCPVAHTERFGGVWLPVNYADLMAVTHDTVTFSSRLTTLSDSRPDPPGGLPPINLDPPDHMKYRRIMHAMFTPLAVRRVAPRVEAMCHQLIDAFIGFGRADAGLDYAQHVPVIVTAEILGVPTSDADRFRRWIHDFVETGPNDAEVSRQAGREIVAYFLERLALQTDHRGDDAISIVARAEVDDEPLDELTKARMLFLLLLGGIDTTWTVLGASLWHLATHPEDQDRLRHEPELLDSALEEFLRFYAPVEIGRVATRRTELSGCPVAEGDQVWLSFPAANRDPAAFADADRFVIDREHNRHLAFGAGAHRCQGSHLARMELKVAISTWLQRVPPFRLQEGATVEWTTGGQVRGPRVIPIAF
jgi:cytochrome P450